MFAKERQKSEEQLCNPFKTTTEPQLLNSSSRSYSPHPAHTHTHTHTARTVLLYARQGSSLQIRHHTLAVHLLFTQLALQTHLQQVSAKFNTLRNLRTEFRKNANVFLQRKRQIWLSQNDIKIKAWLLWVVRPTTTKSPRVEEWNGRIKRKIWKLKLKSQFSVFRTKV
jgi:hypothetical protein